MTKLDLSPEVLERLADMHAKTGKAELIDGSGDRDLGKLCLVTAGTLHALATERRNDFLAGALAMREAALKRCVEIQAEAKADIASTADPICGGELNGATSCIDAIRAIDPASLTEKPAPLPDYDDEVTYEQIATIRAHVGDINPDEWEVASDITQQAPDAEREELAKVLTEWQFGFTAAPSNLDLPVRELMAITGEDLVSQIGRAAELLRQPVAPVVDNAMVERARAYLMRNTRLALTKKRMTALLEAALKGEK
ncbi:MAG: hypothetical protein KBC46_03215 [Ferrovibrio sp.]|nr:hypothetical protein [Ferrovibrio sp.]